MGAPVQPVVRFACPDCGKKSKAPARMAGKKGRCTGCQATIRIPPLKEAAADTERPRTRSRRPRSSREARQRRPREHREAARRPRERRETNEDASCRECGVDLMPGLEVCRRCTRAWSGWYGVGGVLLGIPLAVVGFVFAFASAKATGFAIMVLWMVAALGVVATIAGGVDLVRALVAKTAGRPDPKPVGMGWVMGQLGM